MSIDPSDMADLQSAISAGIQSGFNTYFGPGGPGARGTGSGSGSGRIPSPPSSPGPGTAGTSGTGGTLGTSGAGASAAAATTAQAGTIVSAGEDIIYQALGAFKAGIDAAAEAAQEESVVMRRRLTETYGSGLATLGDDLLNAGDFSSLTNEFAKSQLKSFDDLRKSFGKGKGILGQYISADLEGVESEVKRFQEVLTNSNIRAMRELSQTSSTFPEEIAVFSKGMGISMEDAAKLVNVSFAETGKASTDILTDITNYAKSIGDKVGQVPKDLADDTAKLVINMERFTDIGVPGATRLAASLRNVGLSIPSFESMIGAFETFESAAGTAGDLSAMFGIQVDAIEMMYLANEDQEAFQQRMREELLAQGQDVETMSGAQQRALAKTLGMQVSEMKTFMNTGVAGLDMMSASGEAAGKTQEDALAAQLENLEKIPQTFDNMLKVFNDDRFLSMSKTILDHAGSVSAYGREVTGMLNHQEPLGELLNQQATLLQTIKAGTLESALAGSVGAVTNLVDKASPQITKFSEHIKTIRGNVEDQFKELQAFLIDLFKISSMPKIYQPVEDGTKEMIRILSEDLGPQIGTALDDAYSTMESSTSDYYQTKSMPKIFAPIESGTEYMMNHLDKTKAAVADIEFSPNSDFSNIELPEINSQASIVKNSNTIEDISKILGVDAATFFAEAKNNPDTEFDLEGLKTAIIDAIKQGQAEIKHDLNVTLEMDKKRLAEVLMTAVTSDKRQFMTYTQ